MWRRSRISRSGQWDRIIAINLSSAFHTSRLALPGMKAKGWGRIPEHRLGPWPGRLGREICLCCGQARHRRPDQGDRRSRTAETGVTCNAICPGWVRTPLVERQIEAKSQEHGISIEGSQPRDLLAEKQPTLPLHHPGTAGRRGGLPVQRGGRQHHRHLAAGRRCLDCPLTLPFIITNKNQPRKRPPMTEIPSADHRSARLHGAWPSGHRPGVKGDPATGDAPVLVLLHGAGLDRRASGARFSTMPRDHTRP